jgi:hypothetical protein
MKWHILRQEALSKIPGYLITIAEYDDDETFTGITISVPSVNKWEEEKAPEEQAVANILTPMLLKIADYLGYTLPVSD